ncbi:EamA family transporter [Salinisphaera aquimarina]|uniref:EamA family transporter n=1 Tax=Salinisphaera aquimarina TaxID=2094031 RepID=A0ABV7ENI3_9GAMM
MTLSGVLLALSVVLASVAQILLKHGMNRAALADAGHIWLRPLRQPLVLAGMASQVLLTCLWLVVLSHIDVSLAFPVLSLSYVLVTAYSAAFMGDSVGKRRWCGVLLIVAGVGVLAYGA